LTGAGDSYVRSVLPFSGSSANGSQNKVFVTTSTGIWNATSSIQATAWVAATAYVIGQKVINGGKLYVCDTNGTSDVSGGPTGTSANIVDGTTRWDYESTPLMLTFSSSTGRAGHGVCHVHITSAGHFLLYWDEVNGLHVYSESLGLWAKVVATATNAWVALTAYTAGQYVLNDTGKTYLCVTSGTSAGATGPTGTGSAIVDGSAAWDYVGTVVSGVSPANLVFGGVFKGRVWHLEVNTGNLWYSAVGSIFGALTKFALSTRFKAGGPARCFGNWSYDGGAGLDDALVVVSDGGDVVIYQGTDPASADTFGNTGTWQLGDLPAGRELMIERGGDLWLMTRLGLVPMSKLVSGRNVASEYPTAKISNLFNAAMLSKATTNGWAMRVHPEENALIVMVPEAEGVATTQLVLSLATNGWSRYRDLPIYSSGVFGGKLYFGTTDGRVCINDGYVDGRPLSSPTTYTPVQFSGISAFQNLGSPTQKMVSLIRPRFLGQSTAPSFSVGARYDFDLTELDPVSVATGAGSVWDTAVWDTAVWGGDYSASTRVCGATGIGVNVALAWRGAAVDRTILSGFEVTYQSGGFL
jgi:hypothetical protein